jgi:hypothetical protein
MQDGTQRRGVQDDPQRTGSGGERSVRWRPYLSLLRTHRQKSRESAHLCHQQVQGTIRNVQIPVVLRRMRGSVSLDYGSGGSQDANKI